MIECFSFKKTSLRELCILGLIMMSALSTSFVIQAQESFSPRSLKVEIFADGVVSVDYLLDADATYASINVPLFGTPSGDIIVLNHLGEPLDYKLIENILKVDTLGTYRVRIMYETNDLTNEIGGGIWTFRMNSPINVTIVLPREADIIPNKPPIRIETIKNKTMLVMPPGELELVYTIIVLAPVPVPVEVPGMPAGALAYDHSNLIPTEFFKSIPADTPTVLMFKNFLLIVNSSERVELSLNVGSSVTMKYFKLILKPGEPLSLNIDVDVSPPAGIMPPAGNINIYINITTMSVEATLGIYINETALEAKLGRDIDVSRLTWMHWDGSKWVPVPSSLDAEGYLIANTTHLSTWSIAEIIPLQVTAQLSPETVTQGDTVAILATVKDNAGNPIAGATVKAAINGKIINLSDLGDGNYKGTFETTDLKEGNYKVIVTAQKDGYEQAQTSQTLTVKAVVIPLKIKAQLSPDTVTQGDPVKVSVIVRDDMENPIEGATVTATIDDETIRLSDIGNGKYQGTIDTSNLKEGKYNIVVSAQKVRYKPVQASLTLTVRTAIPWMLYGGIAAVIVIVIVAAVLYRFKRRS